MIKKSLLLAALLLSVASPSAKASYSVELDKGSSKLRSTKTKLKEGEFPNYYEFIAEHEQLPLVESYMASVLEGLQVPHVDETTNKLAFNDFFQKIVNLVHKKDAGAKVYVAGGMVRSLLGYNYKKLFRSVENVLSSGTPVESEEQQIKDAIMDVFHKQIRGGEGLPGEQAVKYRNFLRALGVSSDFDILIDFSDPVAEKEKGDIINKATDFINSAEIFLGLRKDLSKIKKSVVPVGDVKEYQKQLGGKGERSAVSQGGLSLDWLAFDLVNHKIRMPEGHGDILEKFFKGHLEYLPAQEGITTEDKQAIRALRPLLEIPFTRFEEHSELRLAHELEALTKGEYISTGAEEQIEKMLRNARFGSGHNLLAKPDVGEKNKSVRKIAKDLSNKLKKSKPQNLPLAAEFLETHNLDLREGDKFELAKNGILMPVGEFLAQYTQDGNVLHGTPDILSVINMVRNGFLVSKSDQGSSAYGRGFYTAKDMKTAEGYAKEKGIVVPIQVNTHKNLRILNLDSDIGKKFAEEVRLKHPNEDVNEVLANAYDIDIIISQYILIQNAAALKLPKSFKVLLQAQIDMTEKEVLEALKKDLSYSNMEYSLYKWLHQLNPRKGFSQLLTCLGSEVKGAVFGVLVDYLEKEVAEKENQKAADILLHDSTTNFNREQALRAVDKYLRGKLSQNLNQNFIEQWYKFVQDYDLIDIDLDELIHSFEDNYQAKTPYKKGDGIALLKAAEAGHLPVVQFLIESGCSLKGKDFTGNSVIAIVAQKNNIPLLSLLADKGADLEAENNIMRRPLSIAAEYGNLEAIQFLLDRKVDILAKDIEGNNCLFYAARYGKLDAMKLLLERGADIQAKNSHGRTVLGYAAGNGDFEVVKYLIGMGMDIHERDMYGHSLISMAAESGNVELLEYLHLLGLSLFDQSKHGTTALSVAAAYGKIPVIQYLLKNGADINAQNQNALTPLGWAVERGQLHAVKYLIENAADKNTRNAKGESLLVVAAQNDRIPMVKYLVQQGLDVNVFIHAGQNLLNMKGDSLIQWAVSKSDTDLVRLLVEHGVNVHTELKGGESLIEWAIEVNDEDFSQVLIEKGINIQRKTRYGDSILAEAVRKGFLKVLQSLLKRDVDIEHKDRWGNTPLMLASYHGHLEIVQYLLEAGADKNAKDNFGNTSLHMAAQRDKLDVVKYLVEQGLDPNEGNKSGFTPFIEAIKSKSKNVIEYFASIDSALITEGLLAKNLLFAAVEYDSVLVLGKLLSKGVNIESKNESGETPLMVAASWGNLELVQYLIQVGANKNAKDKFGHTSLHNAVLRNRMDVVRFLLESQLDVNEKDDFGKTPLFSAMWEKNPEILIAYLMEKGADVSIRDTDGYDPVLYCAARGNLQALEFLLSKGADIRTKDKKENSLLAVAAINGRIDIARYLLDRGFNLEETNDAGETALMSAFMDGKADMFQFMLDRGANLFAKDKEGQNLLHKSAAKANLDGLKLLLDKGLNLESKDNMGYTPLRLTINNWYGGVNSSVSDFLLERGADINTRDDEGNNLVLSVINKDYRPAEKIKYLIEKGVDIHVRNKDGKDAIMLAFSKGFLDVAELLLSKGGNLDTRDNNGLTPLYYAAHGSRLECVQYLLKKGVEPDYGGFEGAALLALYAANNDQKETQDLLEKGVSINARDFSGRTALSYVVEKGKLNMFQFFMSNGADLELADNNGKKPLDYADSPGADSDLLFYLLEHGHELDLQEQKGSNLLLKFVYGNNLGGVKVLIEKGVDINSKASNGYTPIAAAACGGNIEITQYLLQLNADLSQGVRYLGKSLLLSVKTVQPAVSQNNEVKAYLKEHNGNLYATPDADTPKDVIRYRNIGKIIEMLEAKGAK